MLQKLKNKRRANSYLKLRIYFSNNEIAQKQFNITKA